MFSACAILYWKHLYHLAVLPYLDHLITSVPLRFKFLWSAISISHFHNYLNSMPINTNIQFTYKTEKDGSLLFLDILSHDPDGSVYIPLYIGSLHTLTSTCSSHSITPSTIRWLLLGPCLYVLPPFLRPWLNGQWRKDTWWVHALRKKYPHHLTYFSCLSNLII